MNEVKYEFEIEEAVFFAAQHLSNNGSWRKPLLFHAIRVGTYLYEHSYKKEVVIAGFLHDMLEDGNGVTTEILTEKFGTEVTRLVMASSKDFNITDKGQQKIELIERCVKEGEDALIVKAADILDNTKHYKKVDNKDELENHCYGNIDLMRERIPHNFHDPIFEKLRDIRKLQ